MPRDSWQGVRQVSWYLLHCNKLSPAVFAAVIRLSFFCANLQELRRGADPACMYSIAFSRGERPQWLALSSDKGTVHVFSLDSRQPAPEVRNGPSDAGAGQRNPISPLSFVSVSSFHFVSPALVASTPDSSCRGGLPIA